MLAAATGVEVPGLGYRYPLYPTLSAAYGAWQGLSPAEAGLAVSTMALGLLPAALYHLGVQLAPRGVALAMAPLCLVSPLLARLLSASPRTTRSARSCRSRPAPGASLGPGDPSLTPPWAWAWRWRSWASPRPRRSWRSGRALDRRGRLGALAHGRAGRSCAWPCCSRRSSARGRSWGGSTPTGTPWSTRSLSSSGLTPPNMASSSTPLTMACARTSKEFHEGHYRFGDDAALPKLPETLRFLTTRPAKYPPLSTRHRRAQGRARGGLGRHAAARGAVDPALGGRGLGRRAGRAPVAGPRRGGLPARRGRRRDDRGAHASTTPAATPCPASSCCRCSGRRG
jgi:hypothetical protein